MTNVSYSFSHFIVASILACAVAVLLHQCSSFADGRFSLNVVNFPRKAHFQVALFAVVLPIHNAGLSTTTSYVHLPSQDIEAEELDRRADESLKKRPIHKPSPEKYRDKKDCLDTNWEYVIKPVCNTIHELQYQDDDGDEYDISFLSRGSGQSAYGFEKKTADGTVLDDENWSFVFKTIILDRLEKIDLDYAHNAASKDAIIMEQLVSSPRIVNVYGYCGVVTLAEYMREKITDRVVPPPGYMSQEELDLIQAANGNQVVPQNNLTSIEKLEIVIAMAEAIADLHGFKGGVIMHSDVHLDQFLLSKKGVLKLNDFNDARILSYNPKRSEYCPPVTALKRLRMLQKTCAVPECTKRPTCTR